MLIDFTESEINHIFQNYPTPHHHPGIWSKLIRAKRGEKQNQDTFETDLKRITDMISINLMKSMATPIPPPNYIEQKLDVKLDVERLKERVERLEIIASTLFEDKKKEEKEEPENKNIIENQLEELARSIPLSGARTNLNRKKRRRNRQ